MKYLRNQEGLAPIIIILIVVIATGIIGGGLYMNSQKKVSNNSLSTEKTNQEKVTQESQKVEISPQANNEPMKISANILQLMAKNQSLECDWTPPGMENVTVAKVWVNGTTARSHIETSAEQMGGNNMIIADGVFKDGAITSWVDTGPAGKIGFKMSKEELEKAQNEMTPDQKKQAETYMKQANYSCVPWNVDQSKFQIPADIQFFDK